MVGWDICVIMTKLGFLAFDEKFLMLGQNKIGGFGFEFCKEFFKSRSIKPIVAIENAKIFAVSIFDGGINGSARTAIFLRNNFDARGFGGEITSDFCSIVGRSVINNENFQFGGLV